MAAGQIDIIIARKALKEIDSGIAKIEKMNTEILELSKSVRELNVNLSAVTTPKGIEGRLKKNAEAQLKIKKGVDKVIESETKLRIIREKGFDKFEAGIERQRKANLRQTDSIESNKKALDRQRQAIIKASGAYAKLNKQYRESQLRLANLLSAQKKNTVEIKKAQREFDKLGAKVRKVDAATRNYTKNIGNYSSAFKGAIGFTRQMVSALGLMGGAFLVVQVIRNVIKTIKEFNKETAILASILQKTRKEIAPLTKNAKELGSVTAKTANEVVKLQIAYARLGFTQKEILDLTEATIEGSIALNAQLDETAELTGAVVNSMDALATTDAPRIMDIMALSTAKSALNFEKLSTGLPIVLGAANALEIPFTKVVAILGKLSDAGIETSTSATSLRNIFIESAKQGIDFEKALNKITNSQNKLTTANEIFGKRAAVSALVIANNVEGVKELDKALQDAAGTSKEMADVQLDTLEGDLILLTSAWDGFVVSIEDGEGRIAKAIRGIVDTFSFLLNELTAKGQIEEIFEGEDISLLGISFASRTENFAKASAQLKLLNQDFKELKKEDIEGLANAWEFYEEMLSKATDPVHIKLFNFQLDRIENLTAERRKLNRETEISEDLLFEQRQKIIDVLLEIDKLLDARELEKLSLKELTALLKGYNKESEFLEGSIAFIQELIKENRKLIKETDDDIYRDRLKEENILLAKQIKLLLKVPEAVKAINAVGVGVVTQEELARRERARRKGTGEGTALAGAESAESKLKNLLSLKKRIESGEFTNVTIESSKINEQIKFAKKQLQSFSKDLELVGTGVPLGVDFKGREDITGVSAFEGVLADVTSFVDTYGEQIDRAIGITNSFFDNRIENIQRDIDASNEFFRAQIELAEGNEDQQARLEEERQVKEAELKKKQQKELNKQALINKAMGIAQTAISTAQAIVAALAPPPLGLGPVAGIPLAIATGAIGAAQIALIAATPIPKFKEGIESASKGLGIVGDDGVHEFIETPQGIFKTPDTDTLVQFKGGEKVHKDLDSLVISKGYDLEAINKAAVMTSIVNDGVKLNSLQLADVFNDTLNKFNSKIENKIERGIKRGFKGVSINNSTNFDHSIYKNETL